MSEANGPASAAQRSAAVPRPAGPGSAHDPGAALRAQLWEHSRPAYTIGQAALLLCCSERHVWRQIAKGRIRTVHIGHRTLISRAVLEGLLAGDTDAPKDGAQPLLRVMT